MIKDLDFPEELTGAELDAYLEKGWYRLGQLVFTTDFIPNGEHMYRVFWLRFRLADIAYGKKQLTLLKQNQHFEITIKHLEITSEAEALFQQYRASIAFEVSPTMANYLFDGSIFAANVDNIFQTDMIEVRDRGRLIAIGVFDNGATSIAGILNFYHPEYGRFSPGKFLMLLKIKHAIDCGKEWYYPGYIAHNYTKFDYKLFPGRNAAEIYDSVRQKWLPYEDGLMERLAGL
jgi:leucyl-tRNA---protein transferase